MLKKEDVLSPIQSAQTVKELENAKISVLGKQGYLTKALKNLKSLSLKEKQTQGVHLNKLRQTALQIFEIKKKELLHKKINHKLAQESLDLSLPPWRPKKGHLHPFSQALWELTHILTQMGFDLREGPEIETLDHNFTALNIPEHHPTRQEQDTFYLKMKTPHNEPYVLRTHTSPVQVRTLRKTQPPVRMIVPGRTFRCDSDATHTPNFHQIEGLWIDNTIHMGHLKGCLTEMLRLFFQDPNLKIRLRPAYFPFTEPSAEIDIKKHTSKNWLEVLGCGMVHRKVLENCSIDPDIYQGFAFGIGVERLAMLKYDIADLRAFYRGDPLWVQHYGLCSAQAFETL